jgi:hypothetical protein
VRGIIRLLTLLLFIICSHYVTFASDVTLEEDLQKDLAQSSALIQQAMVNLKSGTPITNGMIRLKAVSKNVRTLNLLLDNKFRTQAEEVKALGGKAGERQMSMAERFRQSLEEYLSLIDSLPSPGKISQAELENLKVLLDKILHSKKRPIHGSLPYTYLNYSAKEPAADPPIIPAYKGGNKVVSLADTEDTEEAPISEEIAKLARSLDWNPVSIYEYVNNNIETEWYWGCMKGAEETLHLYLHAW